MASKGMQIKEVFDLIESNDLRTLRQILSDGYDVNSADEDGYSLLHMAVDFDNERAVQLLVSTSGCRVNATTYVHRLNAIHFAAQDGKTRLVALLLDSGADIGCLNHTNCTPLYFAVSANHLSTVELLLQRGADPNIVDSNSISPLLQSVSIDRHLTQLLLESNARISGFCRELHTSLLSNKVEIADLLLDTIPTPLTANRIGRTPLQNAVQCITTNDPKQAVDLIRKMIELGEDINVNNHFGSLLHILIQRNKLTSNQTSDLTSEAMFEYIIGLDDCELNPFIAINCTGTPLTLAFRLNKYVFAETLVRAGADINHCSLNGFKYTRSADSVLKLLFYCGYHFDDSFAFSCLPIKSEDMNNFKEMVDWLRDHKSRVMSLKNLIRIDLRNRYKKYINKLVQHLNCQKFLKEFILFNDFV